MALEHKLAAGIAIVVGAFLSYVIILGLISETPTIEENSGGDRSWIRPEIVSPPAPKEGKSE